jgi:hypothetical protein
MWPHSIDDLMKFIWRVVNDATFDESNPRAKPWDGSSAGERLIPRLEAGPLGRFLTQNTTVVYYGVIPKGGYMTSTEVRAGGRSYKDMCGFI